MQYNNQPRKLFLFLLPRALFGLLYSIAAWSPNIVFADAQRNTEPPTLILSDNRVRISFRDNGADIPASGTSLSSNLVTSLQREVLVINLDRPIELDNPSPLSSVLTLQATNIRGASGTGNIRFDVKLYEGQDTLHDPGERYFSASSNIAWRNEANSFSMKPENTLTNLTFLNENNSGIRKVFPVGQNPLINPSSRVEPAGGNIQFHVGQFLDATMSAASLRPQYYFSPGYYVLEIDVSALNLSTYKAQPIKQLQMKFAVLYPEKKPVPSAAKGPSKPARITTHTQAPKKNVPPPIPDSRKPPEPVKALTKKKPNDSKDLPAKVLKNYWEFYERDEYGVLEQFAEINANFDQQNYVLDPPRMVLYCREDQNIVWAFVDWDRQVGEVTHTVEFHLPTRAPFQVNLSAKMNGSQSWITQKILRANTICATANEYCHEKFYRLNEGELLNQMQSAEVATLKIQGESGQLWRATFQTSQLLEAKKTVASYCSPQF